MTKGKQTPRLAVVFALVALAVFALQGCQSPQATPTAVSKPATSAPATGAAPAAPTAAPAPAPAPATTVAAPTQASSPETYRIGISVNLTGPGVRMGTAAERFIRFGIEDINAKGGFKVNGKSYRFDAVTVDDKSTADGGREAANRLVLNEKVKVIMGMVSSPLAGAQAITEPSKVISLAFTALDKSLGPQFPLSFQVGFSHALARIGSLYDLLRQENPNAKRVALMFPDDPTGHSIADQTVPMAKARGFEVVAQEFYPTDLKDFGPLVTRILRQSPDAVDVGPAGARGSLFLQQMKTLTEQGFKGPTFGISADIGAMREGVAFMEGFTVAMLVDGKAPVVLDADKQIIQRYNTKYREAELETNPIANYNAPLELAQMMEKAGTVDDTEKMVKAFREMEFDTMYGKQRLGGVKTFGLPVTPPFPVYFSGIRKGAVATLKYLNGTVP